MADLRSWVARDNASLRWEGDSLYATERQEAWLAADGGAEGGHPLAISPGCQQGRERPPLGERPDLGAVHPCGEGAAAEMAKRKRDPIREDRIHNEAIVDAYGPEEQALGWY